MDSLLHYTPVSEDGCCFSVSLLSISFTHCEPKCERTSSSAFDRLHAMKVPCLKCHHARCLGLNFLLRMNDINNTYSSALDSPTSVNILLWKHFQNIKSLSINHMFRQIPFFLHVYFSDHHLKTTRIKILIIITDVYYWEVITRMHIRILVWQFFLALYLV